MADIVVAYYSRTGNTRRVAEKLAALLGADLEEIRERKSRRSPLGWLGAGRDAIRGRVPELESTHSTEGRSGVVIGTPVWAYRPAPAILAYAAAVTLEGRKVFAFCTHDGGPGGTIRTMAELAGAPLAGSLELKKPAKDGQLDAKLAEFAEQIRAALAGGAGS